MGDAIQSFLESYRPSETDSASSIPHPRAACCCGNEGCAYLRQNTSALEAVERDVRTAAQLGQALILRHEAYIADSERERKAMTAHVEHLESEKLSLEQKNATVIAENRDLLDQLEAINNAVTDSDAHVTSLQATLQSTQLELQKLSKLAARTERLEQQLHDYELEQAAWESSIEAQEQSEKSAVRRWQHAERSLADMQEQIERIEREAREEKERHVEVVGRLERRHEVERELTTAAGRLKGAAAGKTPGREPGGTSVVSHFVKDILQDNANLQMGIVELREMLQNSNDEVELLRRQMEDHQPAAEEIEPVPAKVTEQKDLRGELQRAASQELHVHHHYHAPTPTPSANKTPTVRPRRRSVTACSAPATSHHRLASAHLGPPCRTPLLNGKRRSAQSSMTHHSMLSPSGSVSPQSTTNRTSSFFDHVFSDGGHESSRPTTPGSEDLGSPFMAPVGSKRQPTGPFRTASAPIVHRRGISPGTGRLSLDSILGTSFDDTLLADEHSVGHDAIPEENESEWEQESSGPVEDVSNVTSPLSDDLLNPIHTMTTSTARPYAEQHPTSPCFPSPAWTFTPSKADPRNSSPAPLRDLWPPEPKPSDSSRSLLSGMATEQRRLARKSSQGFGSKVGGWVFGRWGATPAPTLTTPITTATTASSNVSAQARPATPKPPSRATSSSADPPPPFDPEATPKKSRIRPPGINQSGPISGFGPEVRMQHPPVMRSLDAEGLRKALGH
ncbi:hypothetical protein LTR87_013339 [Friedmanniomyces endolithicus]|nr:hypothetical protein LTR87_013339 [Friedmanniomyces endolithicus]